MQLIAIVAHDENLLIGRDGGLPWHIPEDLRHFQAGDHRISNSHGTESFLKKLVVNRFPIGETLSLRQAITPVIECYDAIDKALQALKEEDKVFVIGGGGNLQAITGELHLYVRYPG